MWDGLYSLISEGGLVMGEVMGVGLNATECIESPAVHFDCNMIYVK